MKTTLPDGSTAWLVTGFDDVRAGLADPRLSLSRANSTGGYSGFTLPPALDRNLLNLDPPDHTRLRKLVSGAFNGRQVAGMRDKIQATAERLLDGLTGTVDLLAEYAAPLPIITISDLLGVPADHVGDFRDWTDALMTQGSRDAVVSMYQFMVTLIAAKRAEPADDLISAMIEARDGDDRLSEDELLSLAFLVLWAGYENSVHLLANSILRRLDGPVDTEELLRVANPNLHAIRRFPLEDIEIGGEIVPKGQTVLLGIQAANESSTQHLTFGAGIHYCVGAPLARARTRDRDRDLVPQVSRGQVGDRQLDVARVVPESWAAGVAGYAHAVKVIVYGASGMVGYGVLRECLLDPSVTDVLAVGRRPLGQQHEKLTEVVLPDLADQSTVDFTGYDACFFCLGVSSAGMSEDAYRRVTYDMTMAAANPLHEANADATFIYVSGQGTDSTEQGRAMWARVKGKTENDLLKLFPKAYMFRPGVILPMHGAKSSTTAYRIAYTAFRPLFPLFRRMKSVTSTEQIGLGMLAVAKHGTDKKILYPQDINAVR